MAFPIIPAVIAGIAGFVAGRASRSSPCPCGETPRPPSEPTGTRTPSPSVTTGGFGLVGLASDTNWRRTVGGLAEPVMIIE